MAKVRGEALTGLAKPSCAAALILAGASAWAFATDRLEAELKKASAEGFSVKQKLVAKAPWGGKFAIYVFAHESGEYDRLRVWWVKSSQAHLAYFEMSSSHKIDLASVHSKGGLPDLYGDKSRALAYSISALGQSQLRLVRLAPGRVTPERTPLPGATLEDLDQDGRPEVIARASPLGRFFSIECGDFYSMAQGAKRTTIYEFRDNQLTAASQRHAAWFDQHIAQLEGELAGMDPRSPRRAGDYLGAALSLYFDFAEKGLPRQGWSRFSELFRASPSDPGAVADCIQRVRTDLRRRLNVPGHWE